MPRYCQRPTANCQLVRRFDPIVRRFLRDRHVVRVRLAQAGRGDAYELRLRPEVVDALQRGFTNDDQRAPSLIYGEQHFTAV